MKYTVTFDTTTKELKVTKDGMAIDNVTYVGIDKYKSTYYEDEDTKTHIIISTEKKNGDGSTTNETESTTANASVEDRIGELLTKKGESCKSIKQRRR